MNFEQFTPEANEFIKRVAAELDPPGNTDEAYRVTVAVFHTLREMLMPEESLHLIAQLPLLVKALYVHGWTMHKEPRIKTMPDFIARLRSAAGRSAEADFLDDNDAKEKAQAVLKVVKMYVTPGETEDILSQVPPELLELWATQITS
ncbi:MAG TPA: DUF2267 domain-containing protein [Puia sp.]